MERSLSNRRRLAQGLVAALTLAACAPAQEKGGPDGPPKSTDRVAMDGFLVMFRQSGGAGPSAIHLVDPTTGTTGKFEFYLASDPAIAISPDGQRIAWNGPYENGYTPVHVAEAAIEDGAPTLHIVRDFPTVSVTQLAWSPDGDRLYSRDLWMNPSTGEVQPCAPQDARPLHDHDNPIAAFPGNRYLCNTMDELNEDGRLVATGVHGGSPSADGQFLNHTLHIPSGTVRPWAPESDYEPRWAGSEPHLPLPDGRFVVLPVGKHGTYVLEKDGGWTTLYERVTSTTLPLDGALYDYQPIFTSGQFKPLDETWKMKDALSPWFDKGEGRSYQVLGLTADGTRAIYAVNSSVIQQDNQTPSVPVLYESLVSSALVEIAEDGTSRGFLTEEITGGQPAYLSGATLMDLGDGDWLVSAKVSASEGTEETFIGYAGGKPVKYSVASGISPDGKWLYGLASTTSGPQICLRRRSDAGPRCFPQAAQGTLLGVMGQGAHTEYAGDAPLLTGLSRSAAWPGASVTLFGSHFGGSGTVRVGEVEVPSGDVTSWTEHAITFTMSAALPLQGRVRVTTSAGTGGDDCGFFLHRTQLVDTPFDHLKSDHLVLKQGLNALDLGELDAFTPLTGPVALSPAARDDRGRYVVFSEGTDAASTTDVILTSGAYTHALRFSLEPGIADETRWQPFMPTSVSDDAKGMGFVTLAGEPVERSTQTEPLLGTRATLLPIAARAYPDIGRAMPDFWRTDGATTWVSNGSHASTAPSGWKVNILTGFTEVNGQGVPAYAPTPQIQLPTFFQGVAAHGDLVLMTGSDPLGTRASAFLFSTDGGQTQGTVQLVPTSVLPSGGALREPVYVDAATPFFLVLEASGSTVLGVHAIAPDATLTPHITPVPTDALLTGNTARDLTTHVETHKGRVLIHFVATGTLVWADFDAEPAWSVVPSAADARHVRGFYRDPANDDIYAVRDDGTIRRATAAGKWNDWTTFDPGFDLALPTHVIPYALGKTPGGRWVALAQLFDGSPGAAADAPSPLGRAAWLVGPKP